jgi:hypothetical protein
MDNHFGRVKSNSIYRTVSQTLYRSWVIWLWAGKCVWVRVYFLNMTILCIHKHFKPDVKAGPTNRQGKLFRRHIGPYMCPHVDGWIGVVVWPLTIAAILTDCPAGTPSIFVGIFM